MKLLVSACLLGINCKYSGSNNKSEEILQLAEHFDLIPVCPEELGGLPTPRPPAEIQGERVITKEGDDVTEQFLLGAQKTLAIARENNCTIAILKENSPSCASGMIYDGSFSKTLIDGQGLTTRLLLENNIRVLSEKQLQKLLPVDLR